MKLKVSTKSVLIDRSKIIQNIDRFVLQQEPGFPIEEGCYKAPYARGLVVNKLLSHQLDTEIIVGYEGLDTEMWLIYDNKLRLISLKKMGYKKINDDLGHDTTNLIRDVVIKCISNTGLEICSLDISSIGDGRLIGKKILDSVENTISEAEQLAYKSVGRPYTSDPEIPQIRVLLSSDIDIPENLTSEIAIDLVNTARKEMEISSKLLQMIALSMMKSEAATKILSMRSMIDIAKSDPEIQKKLHAYMKDIDMTSYIYEYPHGQISCFNDEMKTDVTNLQKYIYKDLSAPLAETLTEFYERRISDVSWQIDIKKRMDETLSEDEFKKLSFDLLKSELTHTPEGYYTNDLIAQYIIAKSIQEDNHLWILHADREGMLYLNARLGVERVDTGIKKQAIYAQEAIAQIQEKIPIADTAFCLRNVDENIIVVSVPKNTLLDIQEVESQIADILAQMYQKMDIIDELTVVNENFVSHATGVLIKVDNEKFATPIQIIKYADDVSSLYKKYRNRRRDISPFVTFQEAINATDLVLLAEPHQRYSLDERIAATTTYVENKIPLVKSLLIDILLS